MPIRDVDTVPDIAGADLTPDFASVVAEDVPATFDPEAPVEGEKPERKPKAPGLFSKLAKPRGTDGKRIPADTTLGSVWQGIATALVLTGRDIPVGRCMSYQAPVAGVMLDKALEGTLPDKLLIQPIAKAGARGGNIAALIGPPLLVGVIERNPQLYEPLQPVLKAMMMNYLLEAWPHIKAMQKKEKEAQKILDEMKGAGLPDIDSLVESMFAPPPGIYEAATEGSEDADSNVSL